MPPRPKLFVGSSTAGRPIAEILRDGLADVAEVTVWTEGESTTASSGTDEFAATARTFDIATFVLGSAPDRGVLLMLGVFLGALGRERIVICPTSGAAALPSELRGLTVATLPSAIKEHILRLTTPLSSSGLPVSSAPHSGTQVARRRRRSLGTACSAHPGQTLRIADISLTGALLETFGEIPEHQLLDLDLTLEDGRRIRVTAKVVRIQYPQWGRVGGVGVAFTRFEGDSREILQQYLDAPIGPLTSSPLQSPTQAA